MKERRRVHYLLKACEALKETQKHLQDLLKTDYHEALDAINALQGVEESLRTILQTARKDLTDREAEVAAALAKKGIKF